MPKRATSKHVPSAWSAADIRHDDRVILRIDANVPMANGRVSVHGRHRLHANVPEIERLQSRGARIVLVAHLGDPKGRSVKALSLAPVARALSRVLKHNVRFVPHLPGADAERVIDRMAPGAIVMLENLRFDAGETENGAAFAKRLASCGDVFVNNAFSVCHRKHASIVGVTKYLPSFAGELVVREVKALSAVPKKPFVLVLGGIKMSTKIPLIETLGKKADAILIGGGSAMTMLAASMGKRLPQAALFTKPADVAEAKAIAKKYGKKIFLPCDLLVTKNAVPDIGPETVRCFVRALAGAKTIVWNGPLGNTDRKDGFAGTLAVARAIAKNTSATSLVGGGETVECLEEFNLTDHFTHVSTGGGAMLAFLSGEALPGLEVLVK
jgi:phosphoglycerate kinase